MAQTERSRRWRHRLGAVFLAITLLVAQGLPLIAQTTSPLPLPSVTPDAVGAAPVDPLDALAQMIFDGMTPEQRVGQLFVVTFQGDDVQFDSDIVDLITNYHVGGVVLSPRAGNFSNARGVDTPRQVAVLTNQLQAAAYGVLLPAKNALQPVPLAPWPPRGVFTYLPDVTDVTPTNLPLLIGVVQAGDDLPMTALRRGFTPLPSPMALGASWNRAQVTEVGSVVGRELQAVGFNVLLGPALDVFNPQGLDKVNGLGLATFGSNPYWVGQLGRAYIEGVHAGSEGRLATVVSSFPGQGSADRVPTEEVATLQSSQTELRLRDLAPFVVVTRQPSTIIDPAGDPGATDILMTSHMRYTGLQGADSRVRPLSLAPELRTILQQEGFGDWRTRGGVVMSGPLGAQALRRYLAADSPENFRRVAQDAFVAGNDLLFLADFGLDDDWATQSANIKATIQAFQSLYATDPDFAALVNAAARRIIRLKLGIYRGDIPTLAADGAAAETDGAPIVPLPNVLATDTDLSVLASEERIAAEQQMGQIAREAITLLYPDPATQTAPVPPAFSATDNILVFTDFRLQRECATCEQEPSVGPDEVARIIERLYGSQSAGVIDPNNIVSKTFVELTALLDSLDQAQAAPTAMPTAAITATLVLTGVILPTPTPATAPTASFAPTSTTLITTSINLEAGAPSALDVLESGLATVGEDVNSKTLAAIEAADWIIFVMLDVAPVTAPTSTAVKRLLGEHADLLDDQKAVVLALQAPYYLDATEMSKLTAYFGVYSKTSPFLESAVHALFRRYPPIGAPPVDVPGTRFASLNARLLPDPAVQIALTVEDGDGEVIAGNAGEPAAEERPAVVAGSLMRLRLGPILDLNGHTVPDGTLVTFDVRYEGEDVALMMEPAITRNGMAVREVTPDRSGILQISARAHDASSGDGIGIVIIPSITPTPPPIVLITPEEAPPVVDGGALGRGVALDRVNLVTLSIALFTLAVVLSLLLIVQIRVLPRPTLVHNMLWATIFGLSGYILYGIGLFPGGAWLRANVGVWGTPVTVLVPMLLPLLWLQLRGDER
jgi:beta-N-acetylhexosaminidase